jgi:hypothetical protein
LSVDPVLGNETPKESILKGNLFGSVSNQQHHWAKRPREREMGSHKEEFPSEWYRNYLPEASLEPTNTSSFRTPDSRECLCFFMQKVGVYGTDPAARFDRTAMMNCLMDWRSRTSPSDMGATTWSSVPENRIPRGKRCKEATPTALTAALHTAIQSSNRLCTRIRMHACRQLLRC